MSLAVEEPNINRISKGGKSAGDDRDEDALSTQLWCWNGRRISASDRRL